MAIIFGVGFTLSKTNNYRLFFYAFLATPIFLLIDFIFKGLSLKKHNRDFYLWLRHSSEIDYSFFGNAENKHIKTSDIVFSISLFALIALFSVLGAVLFGKDALFDKFVN